MDAGDDLDELDALAGASGDPRAVGEDRVLDDSDWDALAVMGEDPEQLNAAASGDDLDLLDAAAEAPRDGPIPVLDDDDLDQLLSLIHI